MRIMVAYDNSTNARRVLLSTLELFQNRQPQILLIGVAEEPLDSSPDNEAKFQERLKEVQEQLQKAAETAVAKGFDCEVIVAQGDVRKMLLTAVIKHRPDLLVLARHTRDSSKSMLGRISALIDELDFMTLGSVSSFMARRAPCPVLIHPGH